MSQVQNLDVVETIGDYFFISEAGTYPITRVAGVLVRVIFGSNSQPVAEFYDDETLMCRLDKPHAIGDIAIGVRFTKCLTVKTLDDFDLTVVYLGK